MVSRYLVVLRVYRVSSALSVSTVTMLLRDSFPGLNLPLHYFSGFQEIRVFPVFEGLERLRRYTLV